MEELMLLNCGVEEDSRARRSNQSILKEINPQYSLEGLMLKLKSQYFGYLMQRADSLEKTLILGKTEGKRRRGRQRMRWLDSITNSVQFSCSFLSDSVLPHGLQHTRFPCPSPTLGAYSNACPLNRGCHPTISSLSSPSPSTFNPSQHQRLFH